MCTRFLAVVAMLALSGSALAQYNFHTSLHATRNGKDTFYSAANGGFEAFTGVPIVDLGCKGCHGPLDANGEPYPEPYTPYCNDCHQTKTRNWPVDEAQCYTCHGRQKTEAQALGYSDVHRTAGMKCWDCHMNEDLGIDDMHGEDYDIELFSMLEPAGVDADCEMCHTAADLPPTHAAYDPHSGKLHCTTCHAQTVVSCYNCHFESQVESHVKRAKQPIHDFMLLVNRDKDNKVHPASFQSLSYQGTAFVAMGPVASHSITKEGARTCGDCHVNMGGTNEAISEYNECGEIQFAEWDDGAKTLSWKHGVVPLPSDYEDSFKLDFITYDGLTSDPPGPSTNWSSIGKNTWDGHQLFFATPLTTAQMASMGMVPRCDGDIDFNGEVSIVDLLGLLEAWGLSSGPADLTCDGTVDIVDLLDLLAGWGNCP